MRNQRLIRRKAVMVVIVTIATLLCILFTGVAKVRANERQSGRVTYQSVRIEAGDSLWSLCERYGKDDPRGTVSFMKKVASLNQISQDATIHAGNFLIIPVVSE